MLQNGAMRAALYDRFGPPEVLSVGEVPVPVPAAGEVRVRVVATSVNGGDLLARSGALRLLTGSRFPRRTGLEFTGEVVEVGAATAPVAVGDRVWGTLPRSRYVRGAAGAAAEYVVAPVGRVAPLPRGADEVEVVGLLAGGTTAVTALRDVAGLRRGERLLVTGANGGVGSVAIQLGRAMGAHVTAYGNGATLDLLRSLGADEAVDHAAVPVAGLGRFDVVLDTVGTAPAQLRARLARGGRMVAIAVRGLRPFVTVLASQVHGRRRIRVFSGDPGASLLHDVGRFVERGELRPVVAGVHELADIAAAHRALEGRGVAGKHVVRVAAPDVRR